MAKTYAGNFTKARLAVSEKPKTAVSSTNHNNQTQISPETHTGNEAHLFESYVPAAEAPIRKPRTASQAASVASKPKTPQSSTLPVVVKRSQDGSSQAEEPKPLHKRIDKEDYLNDVQKFYGSGQQKVEEPSKISKLIEEIDNQRKVMEKLDRKQKNVLHNTKLDNRRTAAQMIDKFIQTT